MRLLARSLLAALVVTGAARAFDRPAPGSAPFLYAVSGPQATHWIAGSVHLLPEAAHPLPDALEQAYEETRALVLETDLAELGGPVLQGRLLGAAREDRAGGIKARIGKPLYDKLQKHAQRMGMPIPVCDEFRAWFCALALELFPLQQAGFAVENGLDNYFYSRAKEDGRAVLPLEPAEWQIDLFTRMPETLSRQMLAATLDEDTYTSQAPEELYRIWSTGDVARLERLVADMRRAYPALYARLLAQRNRAWMPVLAEKLRGDTPVLIVVGAAHLPGPDGLLALLKAQGFEPRPALKPAEAPAPTPLQQARLVR